MPRPKLYSDEEVLDHALKVLLAEGPTAFTLSDVAKSVGLSRATLIQRFKDKATLHRKVMERLTQEVRDYFSDQEVEPGLGPLKTLLATLISDMGAGAGMEGYLLLMWGDVRDPHLRRLAAERNRLVREAIRLRLPPVPHPPAEAAELIQAVIQGACTLWLVEQKGELAAFMLERTFRMIDLLYPAPA
jgi:TetR/AcrR family macrolide resistance operon transcriptional repressor